MKDVTDKKIIELIRKRENENMAFKKLLAQLEIKFQPKDKKKKNR